MAVSSAFTFSYEVDVSGVGRRAFLERGQSIRATLEVDASGSPADPPRARVALLSGGHVVRTWEGVSVAMIRS